nr:protein downy mildew resistance 6 [Quercus suber]
MLEVATEFFSLPVAEKLKLYTQMTHQRHGDFLQVLMRTRKRFTIGETILDFIVVLWTNMCLSGLPIPLISIRCTNLPENYVRQESDRSRLSEFSACDDVPVIDLGLEDRTQVVKQIAESANPMAFFR